MTALIVKPNIAQVDDVYQRLIELHAGRTEADSMRVNARLILILINHIGDPEAVFGAIDLASQVEPAKGERDR